MNGFFDSELCRRGDVCRKCRRSLDYRRGIVASFDEPTDVDFACPKGKTADDFPQDFELNIFQMGVGFARAMDGEVGAVGKGQPPVPDEERDRRLGICNGCEFLVGGRRCAKCGCYMFFKAKLRSGKCPIGKW